MANTYQGACGRVPSVRPGANFKEAVCIDTNRVYDSVSDKNCLEDLQVTFPDDVQSIVNNCCSLKLKEVEVENVYMDVEPIPFNKGFYTVDITFFFQATFEAQMPGMSCVTITGVTTFTRKMILYGSEGNVKVFCSDQNGTNQNGGMPKVCLQVSAPVALGCRIVDCNTGCGNSCGNINERYAKHYLAVSAGYKRFHLAIPATPVTARPTVAAILRAAAIIPVIPAVRSGRF